MIKIITKILGKKNIQRLKIFQRALIEFRESFTKTQFQFPIPIKVIQDKLEKAGIMNGDTILVHSASNKLFKGYSKPSEKTYRNILEYSFDVIDMLIELVGENGTLLMPTDAPGRPIICSKKGYIFNYKKTLSSRGLITELFRRRPDVIRSVHPFYNVSAWGKKSKDLIKDNEKSTPYVMDKNSPWYKLIVYNGKYIILGKDFEVTSAVHILEDVMGDKYPRNIFHEKLYPLKYINELNELTQMDIKIHKSHWTDQSVVDFNDYLNEKYKYAEKVYVNRVPLIVFDAKKYYNAIYSEMEKDVCFCDFMAKNSKELFKK